MLTEEEQKVVKEVEGYIVVLDRVNKTAIARVDGDDDYSFSINIYSAFHGRTMEALTDSLASCAFNDYSSPIKRLRFYLNKDNELLHLAEVRSWQEKYLEKIEKEDEEEEKLAIKGKLSEENSKVVRELEGNIIAYDLETMTAKIRLNEKDEIIPFKLHLYVMFNRDGLFRFIDSLYHNLFDDNAEPKIWIRIGLNKDDELIWIEKKSR